MAPGKRFFAYHVLATVRASVPQLASDGEFELLSVDELLIREPNKTTRYRVRRVLMKDAGLLDGNVVIVGPNSTVEAGDIVVAAVDGQLTVNQLHKAKDSRCFLEPANAASEPIYTWSLLDIVGLVTGSFRPLRQRR